MDALVERHAARIYAFVQRFLGSRANAEDLTQEVWLRVLRSARDFEGRARFSTWLYRIVANTSSTHLTKRSRHRHDELVDDTQIVDQRPDIDPVVAAETGELRDELDTAIRELPPRLIAVRGFLHLLLVERSRQSRASLAQLESDQRRLLELVDFLGAIPPSRLLH